MTKSSVHIFFVVVALAATWFAAARAIGAEPATPKRARPPKWSNEVRDTFFDDARKALVGQRPSFAPRAATPDAPIHQGMPGDAPPSRTAGTRWSRLIDADTIESEIKRLAAAVAADVTTPGAFQGGGFKRCRSHFSLLAVLFAVDAEYDGPVRWHDVAAGLRDHFALAARNCKVGTPPTYQQAVQRKQELAELVHGSRPSVPRAEPVVEIWSEVADRPPLMQRLDTAHEERLTRWLASRDEFAAHHDDIRHEAQVVALIADVIRRKEYEYWDDAQYAQFAVELQQAAGDVVSAAERQDYAQAQQALTRATRACANCHNGYRG